LDAPPRGTPDVHCSRFFSALGHSRNAVYAQLATHYLARNDLVEIADRFGLNHPVPFDATLPTGHLTVPYNDLQFARASAGFVGSTLSPLGALELAYVVAAGGELPRVRIVSSVGDWHAPKGLTVAGHVMRAGSAYELRRMMEVTVHGGTSLEAFSTEDKRSYFGSMRLAGKTGTLQPSRNAPTTSWFVGFAPSRAADVVVSVQLDNGKVWRRKANEVARDMLRAYFAARGTPGVTPPF
jgi:cell division protein FtsI/penicillin-binding protein 2